MKKIIVGDKVKIIDERKEYETYEQWVKKNAPEWLPEYTDCYRKSGYTGITKNDETGRVLALKRHGQFKGVVLALIVIDMENKPMRVALLNVGALEVVLEGVNEKS